jgi:hypothetical protein
MDKRMIQYILIALSLIIAIVGAYFGISLPVPPMPGPDINAQAVPTQSGPPGDFVSMSYGGTYQDAIAVSVPTANATADTGFKVNNLSVAQPFSIQDAGTAVIEGYNNGGISVYAATAVATGVPALKVNNAGLGKSLEVQDGGTTLLDLNNGGGVNITAPTAVATGVPGLTVNGQGVSNPFEVRVDATPRFYVEDDGDVYGEVVKYASSGVQLVCGSQTITDTANVSHGLTTPSYAVCSLAATQTGDATTCSAAISGSTVTVKVRNSALTPAANSSGIAVGWCVIGTP